MCVRLHAWIYLFVKYSCSKDILWKQKGVGFLLYCEALAPNLFIVRVLAAILISFSLEVYGLYS